MFNSILNKYDPKDIRSHGILKYFVDDLNESEKIEFITSIFEKGSLVLPTEISMFSDSIKLKEKTKEKFHKIFTEWVDERVKYSSKISQHTKNPLVTIDLTSRFREILISIRNLNFSSEIMSVLKLFLEESNPLYLKNFFRNTLSIVIEEYDENEIETFFFYFSDKYIDDISVTYCDFIYTFLNKLAFSHKIYDLSECFLNQLDKLSTSLKKNDFESNYSPLISILLIDLIKEKKLDLSNSKYDGIISETINKLQKSDYGNLEFFKFLKQFNYSFISYNFHNEIEYLFERFTTNISILKHCNKDYRRDILHHYLKFSNIYFESLLFFLEQLNEKEAEDTFIKFVYLIDELRNSFTSLLWFDEFLNFKPINGKIYAPSPKGFEVKINEDLFNESIKLKEPDSLISEKFISHYGFGFLHESSLSVYRTKELHDFFINKNVEIDLSSDKDITSFYVLNLNYSSTFKGKVVQFSPETKSINKILSRYELKAFFTSIEMFLIENACKYLKSESPLLKKTDTFKILIPPDFIYSYNIDFSEETFWNILKKTRPLLYESLYVTHKKNEESFKVITSAFENKTPINGLIKSRTNGGMVVDILGIETFLPGSQIDVKPIQDYDLYLGQTMEFEIININHEFKNIVVSHKTLFEAEIENQKKQIINKLEKGQIFEGIVKNITSYGVFIDLGGFDGLIHITDLTWSRINHPSEVVELNQKINVIILEFDDEKARIQLGLKQLNSHPWDTLDSKLTVGDKVKGKVVLVADYGVFLEIVGGVEGLIHVSEMSWSSYVKSAKDFFNVGDAVEAVILTLDRDDRKMSLGVKQLMQDPWTNITSKYPVGSKHTGVVRNFTSFGIFVELEEAIDGLVYISDLSWTRKIKHPSEFINMNDKLDIVVLELDVEGRKLSLGHKQTTTNPWDKHEVTFAVGTIHKGSINNIVYKGATIDFGDDVVAFIPTLHLEKEDGKKLKKGEEAEFKVIEFNKKSKRVVVSHTLTFKYIKNDKVNKKYEKGSKKLNSIKTSFKIETGRDNEEMVLNKIRVGQKIKGTVIEIADYGVYIKISEGVESLIKVSEMSWNSNLHYAQDFMKIGDVTEAIVINIDKHRGEISSSIKQLTKDPWLEVAYKYPVGSIHIGTVVKFTNFGILISLTKNIDGFLYTSGTSLAKKVNHPSELINIGKELEVVVLELEAHNRKIFLGLTDWTIEKQY